MDVFEKKVLVVGGGKSGIAASALLLSQGKQVILYDGNGSLDVQTLTEKVQAEEAALLEAEKAALEQEKKMQQAMLDIKKKFGKNAILKGMNLQEGATARDRNEQIGGHKA